MAAKRNQRSGIEDRWYVTVVEVDPVTGKSSKRREKSPERYGKGKRWRARYVDPNGVERARSFASKVEAQRYLDSDVTTKVVTGSWVDPDRSGVLFKVVAEKWFTTKKLRKPKTVAGYRSLLDTLVLPRWGEVPLRDVEFEDIQTWVIELSESGGHRFKGKGLSASRVIQAYQVVDQVLRFAIKAKRLAVNPAEEIDLPSKSPAERRYLSHRQVLELAVAIERFRPLVFVLAYTGIRFGEAVALRVASVDLDRRRITVSRSATHVAGLGIVETTTKNHTTRTVPLPSFLVTELTDLVGERDPEALVFESRDGGILPLGEFRWAFDRATETVGLAGLVPHGLRHTAASLAISAGANIKVVQRMLGHKTATLTLDLYGHLFDDDLDPVADAMNRGATAAADELRTKDNENDQGTDENRGLPAAS
ncbi:site-specific integrase [Nocardia sp. NRRL WC-3656]|uniref:tyrosine-type recombinase/integrase n=1 Tax=Nocardia sp. NRRL WC-3656 TaxID=1463824 RepID=UPI0009DEE875|nr:site-specific integrase [Nocardia sp. NRRL WC-3656]